MTHHARGASGTFVAVRFRVASSPVQFGGIARAALVLALVVTPRRTLAQTAPAAATPRTSEEAPSPEVAEARRLFAAGRAAWERGEWSQALLAFEGAQRLAPRPAVRVDIANCLARLGLAAEALRQFEAFLDESVDATDDQRTAVEGEIARLRSQVGELQVIASPTGTPGLEVTVDGRVLSLSGPSHLAPGSHALEVQATGFLPEHRPFDIAAGQALVLDVTLRPDPAAAPSPAPAVAPAATPVASAAVTTTTASTAPAVPVPATVAAPPRPRGFVHRRAWIFAAAGTGAAVLGWTILGAAALGANASFDGTARQLQRGDGDPGVLRAEGHDEAARARTLALGSDVAMGVAFAGAVVTAVLWWRRDAAPAVGMTATVDGGRAGLVAYGAF